MFLQPTRSECLRLCVERVKEGWMYGCGGKGMLEDYVHASREQSMIGLKCLTANSHDTVNSSLYLCMIN